MGPARIITESIEWAKHFLQEINILASDGPSVAGRTFGQQSQMGPVQLASGPMGALNGPSIPQKGYYQIVFSRPNTIGRVTLPMALNGPSISHSGYYRWPQMGQYCEWSIWLMISNGPSSLHKRRTHSLQWAQQELLSIVLNGPRISLK